MAVTQCPCPAALSSQARNAAIAADGRLQTSELLSSNLDWLDANHNGRIEPNDPAYSAIRVWLDVNGDGDSRGPVITTASLAKTPSANDNLWHRAA